MKHRALLRRALPLAVLAAFLFALQLPASAFFFGQTEESTVAPISKNGPLGEPISFSEADFVVDGSGKLDSIVITSLPDTGAGILNLGGRAIQVGDVIAMDAVAGLCFTPLAAPASDAAGFRFTPVFADGQSGEEVSVELHLLSEANGAPVAENLTLTTYKNVAVTGQFSAVDPEGDLITYHLIKKPARGAVTMPEEGSSTFVYTPYEDKTGKDSFTYVAVDAVGNASDPATVKLRIEKPDTKVTYSDMEGDPAHKAAIRLAEEGIYVGECMGGAYFFQPDAAVTRGEFVAMAMDAAGVEALAGVERTGFADDEAIPTWAKAYAASALKAGLVQGSRGADGQVVFQAEEPITAAEAAVLLDRALQVTDVSAETWAAEGVPAWAAQSAANLATCGVLPADSTLESALTRGEAAQMLCSALELLDSRDTGWF